MLSDGQKEQARDTARGLFRYIFKQQRGRRRGENPFLVVFEAMLILFTCADGELGEIVREERDKAIAAVDKGELQ
jgi:hypothetical protein